jgi:hypothetical protein
VDRRLLLCGLAVGAVAVTLALSFRHESLQRSDSAPAAAQPLKAISVPTGAAVPAAAPIQPLPAIAASPELEQAAAKSEPNSAADVDAPANDERNRGTERSGRAR